MTQPERILIIRPSALGDVARTVPALVSLRGRYVDARIDWLVQRGFEDAIRAHPALTQVVSFDRRRLGRLARRGAVCPAVGFLRELRRQRYDLVVDLQGLARSGLFAWATGAAQRIGDRRAREFGWLGLNQRLAIAPDLHTVDRMLEIVRGAGAEPIPDMRLYTPPEDRRAAESDRALEGPYAVIAPTSRWPSKRWPEERFDAVVRHLVDRKLKVIIVGAPDEREQCPRLLDLCKRDQRVIDRIGRTSIGGLMAIIERCDLLIANDSAALHLGVGFGRKLVGLYGPTRIERVGPYRRQRDVIQNLRDNDDLDHKRAVNVSLMERIAIEEVIDRADSLLAEPKARRRD